MKRWAVITVGLYVLALVALTLPTILAASIDFTSRPWSTTKTPAEIADLLRQWGYWTWVAVLGAGQVLLLLVPVDIANRRQPTRRKLLVPVVAASFLLGNLLFAGIFAVLSALLGDKASVVIETPAAYGESLITSFPAAAAALNALGVGSASDVFAMTTALGLLLMFWVVWALVFYHYARSDAPVGLIRRATRWLLRSSILELLVAVPSHVIVRHRNECCAPIVTFWGIATGLSVMLLSFGPGVFFLFARRMRQRRPPGTNRGQQPKSSPTG